MPSATEVAEAFEDTDTDVDTTADSSVDDNDTDDTQIDTTQDDSTDDKADDTTVDDKKDDTDDDEGYVADDEPDDDVATPELPAVPTGFNAEEKYIIDNLPLITVRVVQADDTIKTMQVRSAADLPRDMKGIATPYEDKQFDLANAAQEARARELQTYYRNHQTTVQTQEFERKENLAIRDDVADLQRSGDIPKFKAQPGTRAFDDDPAAKVVQSTIEFMNARNTQYLEKSNKGGAYRHIGFAEAYELMNGKTTSSPKNSDARKSAAGRLKTGQGTTATTAPKAAVSGRTIKEVAAEFEDGE